MSQDVGRATGGRDDTHTESLRRERGEPGGAPDPRDEQARVPIAPHSAGVLGVGAAPGADDAAMPATAEADASEARKRSR